MTVDWSSLIEASKERLKNRVPCGECKHALLYSVCAMCINEKSDACGLLVRLTTSCMYGERE
jgi:recombinational DNA repair protein RecR